MNYKIDFGTPITVGDMLLLIGYSLALVTFAYFIAKFLAWETIGAMAIRATILILVFIFTGAYLNRSK